MVKKKSRIQVDLEVASAELGSASELGSMARTDGAVMLPSSPDLQRALDLATGSEDLSRLREAAATYQDIAKRLKAAKEELVRLAIWRIDVERKLGQELSRTVGRGGSGSKFHNGTSKRGGATHGLPDLVKKGASKRYQDLAAIPQEILRGYLAQAAKRGTVPSPGGARRFSSQLVRALPSRPRLAQSAASVGERGGSVMLSPEVLEAVQRFLGGIDVLIGSASVCARVQTDAQSVSMHRLRGSIFVVECPDPASWMPRFAELRLSGSMANVLVALSPSKPVWFSEVPSDWAICVLSSDVAPARAVLAYHGSRNSLFKLAFQQLGILARGFSQAPLR